MTLWESDLSPRASGSLPIIKKHRSWQTDRGINTTSTEMKWALPALRCTALEILEE